MNKRRTRLWSDGSAGGVAVAVTATLRVEPSLSRPSVPSLYGACSLGILLPEGLNVRERRRT